MTVRQIQKELERQAVLFEERCRTGQVMEGNIKFAAFAEKWFADYAEKQAARFVAWNGKISTGGKGLCTFAVRP